MARANTPILGSTLVLGLFLLVPGAARGQHFPPDEEVELMLRYLVEDGKAEGIVVGFLEADGATRILSYGSAGPGGLPLGPRSVFETGSIGKTFTATLLADMVIRGKVALEDPVSKYLPDSVTVPSYGGREITLLDLATHRSGFPKNADNHTPADPMNPYADFTTESIYRFLSGYELRREPGVEFKYSNIGFQLLGHALALAAGTTYTELHRQRILVPLGMDSSGFTLDGERAEWAAQGHRNGSVVPYWTGTEARLGAGGLFANAEDLLKYLEANVGPPETELEEAMRMAHEPRLSWGESGDRIGLAWRVESVQGRNIVEHGGNTNGFTAFIGFDPEERVGLVWLTNTYGFADGTPLEILAHGRRPEIDELRMTPGALSLFVGEYQDPSGSSLHVRLEPEGFLTIQSPRRARFRLYAETDSSFTLDRGSSRLVFQRSENGEVSGVRMEPNQSGEIARKVRNGSPPPRVVAAGGEWHGVSLEWHNGYWLFFVGLGLLVTATLGAEVRRVLKRRMARGS